MEKISALTINAQPVENRRRKSEAGSKRTAGRGARYKGTIEI